MPLLIAKMKYPINRFSFNVLSSIENVILDQLDPELQEDRTVLETINQPSNMTHVCLTYGHKFKYLDFTGTTVLDAIKKILTFYNHATHRRMTGDHIYFEGFDVTELEGREDDILEIHLGS